MQKIRLFINDFFILMKQVPLGDTFENVIYETNKIIDITKILNLGIFVSN